MSSRNCVKPRHELPGHVPRGDFANLRLRANGFTHIKGERVGSHSATVIEAVEVNLARRCRDVLVKRRNLECIELGELIAVSRCDAVETGPPQLHLVVTGRGFPTWHLVLAEESDRIRSDGRQFKTAIHERKCLRVAFDRVGDSVVVEVEIRGIQDPVAVCIRVVRVVAKLRFDIIAHAVAIGIDDLTHARLSHAFVGRFDLARRAATVCVVDVAVVASLGHRDHAIAAASQTVRVVIREKARSAIT